MSSQINNISNIENNNNSNNNNINLNNIFEISNSENFFINENNNNINNLYNNFSPSVLRFSSLFHNNENNRHLFELPIYQIIPLRRGRRARRIRFENINFLNRNNNIYYFNNIFNERKKFLEILSNIKIQRKYGALFVNTLKKLLQKNIFILNKLDIFLYNKFCHLYLHLKEKYKDSKYIIFFECFPKFKHIICIINKIKNNFNDKKNYNEIFFIKIMLDLFDDHLEDFDFDFDLDKKIINDFYLTSILFYSLLSEDNLIDIYKRIKKLDIEFYSLKNNKKYSEMNLDEYQQYFIKNKKIYENLIGGINDKEGLFIQ
jgi:hypothetical protein